MITHICLPTFINKNKTVDDVLEEEINNLTADLKVMHVVDFYNKLEGDDCILIQNVEYQSRCNEKPKQKRGKYKHD